MGYLICGKCKSYYKLHSGESANDFADNCECGGKFKYVQNLDIVDPNWKEVKIPKRSTRKEILMKTIQSIISALNFKIKYPLVTSWNKWKYQIHNALNRNTTQYSQYDMGINPINSIINELNFRNIQWVFVIPIIVAITLILVFEQGILTLLTFFFLVILGYLLEDQIIGIKNAVIAGAISYFLGTLLTGSFLLVIPFALLGAVNGAVCGWVGGYLKKIISKR